jgi:hypothetical protein
MIFFGTHMDMILHVNFYFTILVPLHEFFIICIVDHASCHDVMWVDHGDMSIWQCYTFFKTPYVCIIRMLIG